MKQIAQILQESKIEPIHGEIKLGYTNGWDDERIAVFSLLKEHKIDGTNTTRDLGRCLNEYSFMINDGTDEYNVVYLVDSGD